ncbi:hypothetical protein KIW84_035095 [Lathyrus oleraceus]|uniref:Zinc knuckle CX2CX4HX4C domain-containing protein n=1 Tax=Pisum sativum TaxID=3888 RepID=A0A9D4Y2W3_PEA|nr:hypothetical protein KIW84_035095 [Pisum sativum]
MGVPIAIDEATRSRLFGHYAKLLVNVDLEPDLQKELLVEREGFAFVIQIVYEKIPEFCHSCQVIGHFVHECSRRKIESVRVNEKLGVEDNKEVHQRMEATQENMHIHSNSSKEQNSALLTQTDMQTQTKVNNTHSSKEHKHTERYLEQIQTKEQHTHNALSSIELMASLSGNAEAHSSNIAKQNNQLSPCMQDCMKDHSDSARIFKQSDGTALKEPKADHKAGNFHSHWSMENLKYNSIDEFKCEDGEDTIKSRSDEVAATEHRRRCGDWSRRNLRF